MGVSEREGGGGNFANDAFQDTKQKRKDPMTLNIWNWLWGFVSAGGTNWDPILSQGQKISSFGGSNREEIRIMIQ